MFKIPQKVISEIDNYRNKLLSYLEGKINDNFFKGIRVPWGFYSQRGGKILMSRLRIPAGILNAEQLRAIGIASQNFADGKLHITTRQDIQIHNVPFENSIKIIEYLKDYNISPRAGGGNTIRNVCACYLSGICKYENYEVYKINWDLTEYLLSLDESTNLPRKIKIAFSGCHKDCAFTGVNDLGFVALNNGKFKVLCGGGMGANSSVGKVLENEIEIDEIPFVTKAVINLFNKYGDRKNRYHNRLRFLIEDLNWEKFKNLYKNELEKVKNEEYINLNLENGINELPRLDKGAVIGCAVEENYNLFLKYNVSEQKQKNYYYVQIRIPTGEINSNQLIALSELEKIIPHVIFRTTQRQNIIVSNIPFNKLYYVYEKIKENFNDFLFPETFVDIISCKAAQTCNLGICNAIAMARIIIDKLNKKFLDDLKNIEKLNWLKININGCPNACGQHPIGVLSFSGLAKKVYNRTAPFYRVHFGGKIDMERTKLAKEMGIIPAKSVPDFVVEFVQELLKDEKEPEVLITSLTKKYSYVPSYEENRDYYIDFGKSEDFSLDGLSQGECGAGVLDMIESDLFTAKESLKKAESKKYDIQEIKKAILYSARALLVVRGLDPKNEDEVLSGFIEKFVNSNIAKKDFENLKEVYYEIKNGDEREFNFTKNLYDEVKRIYDSMDSNFNFPVIQNKEEKSVENAIEKIYDLRGTPCPLNYVKAKLKLEELEINDILEIYLDEGDPIKNVPVSLKNDGQEILEIKKEENFYKVKVKKKC